MFCTAHPLLRITFSATSKMAAVFHTSAKRTNKSRFRRAKPFIRNSNAADRLTTSWFAIEKQENERNVRDPEVCSGLIFTSRPSSCRIIKLSWLRLWIMGAVKPVGQLSKCINEPLSGLGCYCTYVFQTPRVERRICLAK